VPIIQGGTFPDLRRASAEAILSAGDWDAIVCLGCLIRGETPHFDYIASAAAQGITAAGQQTGVPVAFGVLTTNPAEAAIARAGDGQENTGREAALAALEMARRFRRLGRPPGSGTP
jgi:6,7-dimethyl-8-ribityllumazine synthase